MVGSHPEFVAPNGIGVMNLNDYSENTFVGATGVVGGGTVPIPTGLTFFHNITKAKIDDNLNVNGFVGGMPRGMTQATVCIGARPQLGLPVIPLPQEAMSMSRGLRRLKRSHQSSAWNGLLFFSTFTNASCTGGNSLRGHSR